MYPWKASLLLLCCCSCCCCVSQSQSERGRGKQEQLDPLGWEGMKKHPHNTGRTEETWKKAVSLHRQTCTERDDVEELRETDLQSRFSREFSLSSFREMKLPPLLSLYRHTFPSHPPQKKNRSTREYFGFYSVLLLVDER